jgi:CBS domain-containing protein
MTPAIEKLDSIAEQIRNGVQPPEETVRSILSWFGAERRGRWVVATVRTALDHYGLMTAPDIEYAWIDASVRFTKKQNAEGFAPENDPTFRVGRLDAANKTVVSVKPDDTREHAVTLMLENDFSQLPVMVSTSDVKGIISWRTIGSRLAIGNPRAGIKDFIEPAEHISQDKSLLDAVNIINKHDYVLVLASDKTVSGLITASDFTLQFKSLAEPFLLVGEIENGIRRMLDGKFTAAELQSYKNPGDKSRTISRTADLTFGEYVRLLENPQSWTKLHIAIDRLEFTKQLHRIRTIRNDVMHFDPDGLDPDDLGFLYAFAQFLKQLRDIPR